MLARPGVRSSTNRPGRFVLGSKLMSHARSIGKLAIQGGRGLIALLSSWIREQSRRTVACRECDVRVSISETVCPRCGAADPARIPMSAVTAILAVCACVVLAMIVFG